MSLKRTDSTISTESFSEDELLNLVDEHDVLPSDTFFTDPISGERVQVGKTGESLPIHESKWKKRRSWPYAYKFR